MPFTIKHGLSFASRALLFLLTIPANGMYIYQKTPPTPPAASPTTPPSPQPQSNFLIPENPPTQFDFTDFITSITDNTTLSSTSSNGFEGSSSSSLNIRTTRRRPDFPLKGNELLLKKSLTQLKNKLIKKKRISPKNIEPLYLIIRTTLYKLKNSLSIKMWENGAPLFVYRPESKDFLIQCRCTTPTNSTVTKPVKTAQDFRQLTYNLLSLTHEAPTKPFQEEPLLYNTQKKLVYYR